MGTIYGTCGHELTASDGPDGFGTTVAVAAHDRECQPCVEYPTLCNACHAAYRESGVVMDAFAAARWLRTKAHEKA